MKTTRLTTIQFLFAAGSLCLPLNAADQGSGSSMQDAFDKLWGHATLYSNKDNAFVQKLAFTGRLQYDYAQVDEDDAGSWDDWTWRRARAGFKATVFNTWTVHVEGDFDLENADPLYNALTDAYIGWSPSKNWSMKFGRQSTGFTLDGATSSKSLITAERSKLAEHLWFNREYFTGVSLSGEQGTWSYTVGLFSNDNSDEFEQVGDAEHFVLASVGRDFAGALGADQALLRLDYVNNKNGPNLGTRNLSDIVSLSGQYTKGRFHLWADLAYGKAFNDNEISGFEVMPFFDISKTFQVVLQYTYLSSSDPNGISLGRYEGRLVGGRGDRLEVVYAGVNTYLYGHKLKWQNGIQYVHMSDSANDGGRYNGIGFTSAIRLSW